MQPRQQFYGFDYTVDEVRVQEIVTDQVAPGIGASPITAGPFTHVAQRPCAKEVYGGNEYRLPLFLHEVGEGHRAEVRVIAVFASHHRVRPEMRRCLHVGVAPELASTLGNGLVECAELVGMIAHVRPAADVRKRKAAGDGEARFVVGNGVWSGKDRYGFALREHAVGEKQTVDGRKALLYEATLAYEAAFEEGAVDDVCTGGEDETSGCNPDAHDCPCSGMTQHCAVVQTGCADDFSRIADAYIRDAPATFYYCPTPYASARLGSDVGRVGADVVEHAAECVDAVTMKNHQVSRLRRQSVEDRDGAASVLVRSGHAHAVSGCSAASVGHRADVRQASAVTDLVSREREAYACDAHTVADDAIMNRSVIKACRKGRSAVR